MSALAYSRMTIGAYQAQIDAAAARATWVEQRGIELKAQYAADLEFLSDAIGDISYYRVGEPANPAIKNILELIRDGSDDCELGRQLREVVLQTIGEKATQDAEDQYDEKEDDRVYRLPR